MYIWRHIPLLRFLIPYALGIHFASAVSGYFSLVIGFAAAILGCLVFSHIILRKNVNLRLLSVAAYLAICLVFLSGIIITHFYRDINFDNHFSHTDRPITLVLARVVNNPEIKPKSIGCELSLVKAYDAKGAGESIQGVAQGYFEIDSTSQLLRYGDYILVHNNFSDVRPSLNPHQFDFKKYYENKNIYQQGYFKGGDWKNLKTNQTNPLFALSYRWQASLRKLFDQYFLDDQVKGVAQAIVFGYKEDLDDDWLKAFSKTGTIHVLAVSGLHVGIIFILLGGMLRIRQSKGRWLIAKSLLAIFILFLYCLITGFAPSVARASLMFTVVILARAFNRNSNIYNTLTFAAFVLLLFNPLNLYNVGFQFSFLAVIGIVYYKDAFRRWLPQNSWLGDKVVTLTSVSIAAQITTFPIGLYYFHQYPNFFMFSNLIVIPCITIILYSGIFFVALGSWIPILASFFSSVSETYILFIAKVVHFIQDVPYAFFDNVHITFSQMICIYLIIILGTITWVNKWQNGVYLTAIAAVLFLVADLQYNRSISDTEMILFDVRNETLIGFKQNGFVTFLASEGIYKDQSKIDFIITPYIVTERLSNNYCIYPSQLAQYKETLPTVELLGNGFVWFNGKRILLLDGMRSYIKEPIDIDILLVGATKNEKYLSKVAHLVNANQTFLLDNWRVERLKMELNNHETVIQKRFIVIKLDKMRHFFAQSIVF
ncbi:MAG: ComEC/Rec2 family competence protein [Bacteroidia bacterium]